MPSELPPHPLEWRRREDLNLRAIYGLAVSNRAPSPGSATPPIIPSPGSDSSMRKLPREAKPLLLALALAGCATAAPLPPSPSAFSLLATAEVSVRVRAQTAAGCERLRDLARAVVAEATVGVCSPDQGPLSPSPRVFPILSDPIALYGGVVRAQVDAGHDCEDVRATVLRHIRKMTARATAGRCGEP